MSEYRKRVIPLEPVSYGGYGLTGRESIALLSVDDGETFDTVMPLRQSFGMTDDINEAVSFGLRFFVSVVVHDESEGCPAMLFIYSIKEMYDIKYIRIPPDMKRMYWSGFYEATRLTHGDHVKFHVHQIWEYSFISLN